MGFRSPTKVDDNGVGLEHQPDSTSGSTYGSSGSTAADLDPAGPSHQLKRGLSSRHLQMIAIGGAIGTGLFVASGGTTSQAGLGGALAAYALVGLMVFLLMQSLGEMSAKIPVAGSFQAFATRFVSPSFGFAIGWNYWFNWAITVAAELVAAGIIRRIGVLAFADQGGRRGAPRQG